MSSRPLINHSRSAISVSRNYTFPIAGPSRLPFLSSSTSSPTSSPSSNSQNQSLNVIQQRRHITLPHPDLDPSKGITQLHIRTLRPMKSMLDAFAIMKAVEAQYGSVLNIELVKDKESLQPLSVIRLTLLRPINLKETKVFEIPSPVGSGFSNRLQFGGPSLSDISQVLKSNSSLTKVNGNSSSTSRFQSRYVSDSPESELEGNTNEEGVAIEDGMGTRSNWGTKSNSNDSQLSTSDNFLSNQLSSGDNSISKSSQLSRLEPKKGSVTSFIQFKISPLHNPKLMQPVRRKWNKSARDLAMERKVVEALIKFEGGFFGAFKGLGEEFDGYLNAKSVANKEVSDKVEEVRTVEDVENDNDNDNDNGEIGGEVGEAAIGEAETEVVEAASTSTDEVSSGSSSAPFQDSINEVETVENDDEKKSATA